MNLLLVSGSQRAGSQSKKVAQFLISHVLKTMNDEFISVESLDLIDTALPIWDGADKSLLNNPVWTQVKEKLVEADALILITPEWSGMASPLIKNFMLICSEMETGHKPTLLTSISSGINGAYPIAELRMNATKNNKMLIVPDHLIIRDVENVLNQSKVENKRDFNIRARINYSLHMLATYSRALQPVRIAHQNQSYPNQQDYAYGM